ncbi:hypothetical protein DACRYDRAFT_82277 [Dacryopinax primogenitus]|uniref:ABC transporter domain-containing protein n=1 Tax=Dacryopinax primogenitus (strain DJM 731) TaxID=1858805 RepID=M5G623_DACPD|nr:uncharacterized protein DACRYDRAFT_82277 [Dacryopinax primogenitus]EJT99192.1 hypothetical protein DACRYDRAFT_82277 [Dacryopinax primogenitus]
MRELYSVDREGNKVLLVPTGNKVSRVPIHPTPESLYVSHRALFPLPTSSTPGLNRAFLSQLRALLRIILPKPLCKESFMLALHSAFLVLRTVLSVAVARLDGRLVRDLVSADWKGFLKGLGLWFLLAIPSTYTNAMLRYLQSKLSLAFRTRLTRYTHDLYLSPNLEYYRLIDSGYLNGGADQYITNDVQRFCDALSALYGNLLKPTLDMIIFTTQLAHSLGGLGTVGLFANYFFTGYVLRRVTPAFGKLAAVEARLEGEYRAGVGRIGRESEEIAFYGGGLREKSILARAYQRLISHVNSIYKIRIAYEWTEDYIIKYLWSATGYMLMSIPVFLIPTRSVGVQAGELGGKVWDQVSGRTESYISNRRLLLSLADAGGRLMYSNKDLAELAGYTSRVYTLLSTLHHLDATPVSLTSHLTSNPDRIALTEVNVAAPGQLLVRDLNLVVERGEHTCIVGANGVGKTAIARVVAGLWEAEEGEVERPLEREDVMVVPQRAYLTAGSLRDQVIYPFAYPQHISTGGTDAQLQDILKEAHLEYLLDREGGWDTVKEWKDVLSGGEKQRMGMARLFYHKPSFAILDECTSAVSTDVESHLYNHAKSLGITILTISTRPALIKYHTRLLKILGDGRGGWELTKVGTEEERMEVDREIGELERRLGEVGGWEGRLGVIKGELGV